LRLVLQPDMSKQSFANWVARAQKQHGFPEPIRIGARSCAWSVAEVRTWLASRPRKGVFSGQRRASSASA
jgi:predicted DNA-binding transcriptional regulator AlpA